MGLTEGEKKRLGALFKRLNNENIRYVVLREDPGLPDRVENNVDMLIDTADFERAINLAQELGFERARRETSVSDALSETLRHPLSATRKGLALINTSLSQWTKEQNTQRDEPRERRLHFRGLKINAVNRLPAPGGSTNEVPEALEDKMLACRERQSEFYVPTDVDTLAYGVVHYRAGYEGEGPPFCEATYETLAETVSRDADKRAEFRGLMEILFDEIAQPITERVLSGEFDSLKRMVGDRIEGCESNSSQSRARREAHS